MLVEKCKNIKKEIENTNLELNIVLNNLSGYKPADQLKIIKNLKKKLLKGEISKCVKDFFYFELKNL